MSLAEAEQVEVAGGDDATTPPGAAEADLAGAEKERAEEPASGPDLLGTQTLARDLAAPAPAHLTRPRDAHSDARGRGGVPAGRQARPPG